MTRYSIEPRTKTYVKRFLDFYYSGEIYPINMEKKLLDTTTKQD